MKDREILKFMVDLREEVSHDLYFAQALLEADEETMRCLSALIYRTRMLRSKLMTLEEKYIHDRLKGADRARFPDRHTSRKVTTERRRVLRIPTGEKRAD